MIRRWSDSSPASLSETTNGSVSFDVRELDPPLAERRRWQSAILKAVTAARLALHRTGETRVSLAQEIETMCQPSVEMIHKK